MGIKDEISEALKGIIQAKAQVAESMNLIITINVGDHYYNTKLPDNTDPQKFQKIAVTSTEEKLVQGDVLRRLPDNVSSLPEHERKQLIADSTAASVVDVLVRQVNDKVNVKEDVRVKLSPPSTEKD